MDDQDRILQGCRQNDRTAQQRLYRYYFGRMLPMVRRHTQDQDVIISVMNNGFLKVFKSIDQYTGQGSLDGWIRTIIYRAIVDHFRLVNNQFRYIQLDDMDISPATKPTHSLEYDELLETVNRLPSIEAEVFSLHAIYGYRHAEIADMLDIKMNTSKWYLAEARKKLQKMIRSRNAIQRHG